MPIAFPVICSKCGREAAFRFAVTWPPPQLAFDMRVTIKHAGETRPYFDTSLKQSASSDGTMATVYQEFDRRDADKQNQRYRKKVIKADGRVVKDVDVSLTSNAGHGNAGVMKDPPPPSPPGDPMYVKLGITEQRPRFLWRSKPPE